MIFLEAYSMNNNIAWMKLIFFNIHHRQSIANTTQIKYILLKKRPNKWCKVTLAKICEKVKYSWCYHPSLEAKTKYLEYEIGEFSIDIFNYFL